MSSRRNQQLAIGFVGACLALTSPPPCEAQPSLLATTTSTSTSTTTLPGPGFCTGLTRPVTGPLAALHPGSKILFWGDSIVARGFQDEKWTLLVAHLLNTTYSDYCSNAVIPKLQGKVGRKSYDREAQDSNIAGRVTTHDPRWVVIQDSGQATPLTDSITDKQFRHDVVRTVNDEVLATWDANAPGDPEDFRVLLVSSHPFDPLADGSVGSTCAEYVEACNWAGHNQAVEQFVDTHSDPRVLFVPTAERACNLYQTVRGRGDPRRMTSDGVHLEALGQLLYAFSLLHSVGFEFHSAVAGLVREFNQTFFALEDIDLALNAVLGATLPAGDASPCVLDPAVMCGAQSIDPEDDPLGCLHYCALATSRAPECRPAFTCRALVASTLRCDDGALCTSDDRCAAGRCSSTASTCPICPGALATCEDWGSRGKLRIAGPTGGRTRMQISLTLGEVELSELGDPADVNDPVGLRACLYGSDGRLIWSGALPAGETCSGGACWRSNDRRIRHRNREHPADPTSGNENGVNDLTLRTAVSGRPNARTLMRLRGRRVLLPFDFTTAFEEGAEQAVLQLLTTNGAGGSSPCWQTALSVDSVAGDALHAGPPR